MFFLNTLYIQNKKLLKKNYKFSSTNHFILNVLYHFSNIELSLLKYDLAGLPIDQGLTPVLTSTHYE